MTVPRHVPSFVRKQIKFEIRDIDDKSRSFWAVASEDAVDRYGDTIDQNGWKLDNYKANPVVLWAHDKGLGTPLPAIGKATEIKVENGRLMFKPEFAPKETYAFADTIFKLYKGGYLRAFSVGFIPLTWEEQKGKNGLRYTEQELLEVSCVNIPALPSALIAGDKGFSDEERAWVAKAFDDTPADLLGTIGGVVEKAIPSVKNTPKADEDVPWSWDWAADADAVIEKLGQKGLANACGWYDENGPDDDNDGYPDRKQDYKLPHHKLIDGSLTLVWKGVAAAMQRLMQAKTDIPDDERRKVYDHLAAHCKAFGKEPPEFKELGPEDEARLAIESEFGYTKALEQLRAPKATNYSITLEIKGVTGAEKGRIDAFLASLAKSMEPCMGTEPGNEEEGTPETPPELRTTDPPQEPNPSEPSQEDTKFLASLMPIVGASTPDEVPDKLRELKQRLDQTKPSIDPIALADLIDKTVQRQFDKARGKKVD